MIALKIANERQVFLISHRKPCVKQNGICVKHSITSRYESMESWLSLVIFRAIIAIMCQGSTLENVKIYLREQCISSNIHTQTILCKLRHLIILIWGMLVISISYGIFIALTFWCAAGWGDGSWQHITEADGVTIGIVRTMACGPDGSV